MELQPSTIHIKKRLREGHAVLGDEA